MDVCDSDPERLADAVAETGARPYPSLEKMLSETDADCVVLASPSGLHSAQAIQGWRRPAGT